MTRSRTFAQVKASIFGDKSLHKIVDGVNYGICIDKLTARFDAELSAVQKKQYSDYPGVMAMSSDPDALQKVWNVIVDEEKARELVYAYLDEHECCELLFTSTTMRGMASDRGIRLPPHPTLGLVLHEIAHQIQRHDKGFRRLNTGKRDVHGQDFVKILDGLVKSEGSE